MHSPTEAFFGRMDRLDELCEQGGRDPGSLPRGLGLRRLYSTLGTGDESFGDVVAVTQRCIRRGVSQVVLYFGQPDGLDEEMNFYVSRFIPEVMSGV